MLEHITRELNIEALPTDDPRVDHASTSRRWRSTTRSRSPTSRARRHHAARRSRGDGRRDARRRRASTAEDDEIESETERRRRGRGARRATPPSDSDSSGADDAAARPRRSSAPVDWLVVGLGNPGARYAGTRHNIGFEVANALAARWDLPRAKTKFNGLLTRGPHRARRPARRGAAAADVHERGRALGRPGARRATRSPLERVLVVHDEIDLPFGDVRTRIGGGLAGHNGLKSLKAELGGADFARVRIGVGRPDSTDPEIVSAHVLGALPRAQGRRRRPRRRARRDAAEAIVLGEREL